MARLRVALWPVALLAGSARSACSSRRTTTTRRRSRPSSPCSSAGRSRSPGSSRGAGGPGTASGRSWWRQASPGFSTSLTAANDSILFTLGTDRREPALRDHHPPAPRVSARPARVVGDEGDRDRRPTSTTVGLQLLALLFYRPSVGDCPGCPPNAILVTRERRRRGRARRRPAQLAACSCTLAVGLIYAQRWRAATPPARRMLGPVLVTGALAVVLLGLSLLARLRRFRPRRGAALYRPGGRSSLADGAARVARRAPPEPVGAVSGREPARRAGPEPAARRASRRARSRARRSVPDGRLLAARGGDLRRPRGSPPSASGP